MKIKINEKLPDSEVFQLVNGNPVKIKISSLFLKKKIILLGVPGAFTSVCSKKHLPSFINYSKKFYEKGVDQIFCIAANDPFVMNAWGKINKVENNILMLADPFLNFTKSIGAEVDKSERGLGLRSNRYTMLIDNLNVLKIQEEKETGVCDISSAENFLKLL